MGMKTTSVLSRSILLLATALFTQSKYVSTNPTVLLSPEYIFNGLPSNLPVIIHWKSENGCEPIDKEVNIAIYDAQSLIVYSLTRCPLSLSQITITLDDYNLSLPSNSLYRFILWTDRMPSDKTEKGPGVSDEFKTVIRLGCNHCNNDVPDCCNNDLCTDKCNDMCKNRCKNMLCTKFNDEGFVMPGENIGCRMASVKDTEEIEELVKEEKKPKNQEMIEERYSVDDLGIKEVNSEFEIAEHRGNRYETDCIRRHDAKTDISFPCCNYCKKVCKNDICILTPGYPGKKMVYLNELTEIRWQYMKLYEYADLNIILLKYENGYLKNVNEIIKLPRTHTNYYWRPTNLARGEYVIYVGVSGNPWELLNGPSQSHQGGSTGSVFYIN